MSLALTIPLAFALSYLIGAVNPAALIARTLRVDLRSIGSGNVGATNAGRALGNDINAISAFGRYWYSSMRQLHDDITNEINGKPA